MSPHLLPHSTWARSCEPPAEGEELCLAVATLNVLRYHRLSDVEPLVSNALRQYCFCLEAMTRSSNSDTVPGGCGFSDTDLDLAKRIETRYQLAKKFIGPIAKFDDGYGMENGNAIIESENENKDAPIGMENGNGTVSTGIENVSETVSNGIENWNVDQESYLEYYQKVLKEVYAQVVAMDVSGCGIERYFVGEVDWEAGKLPKKLSSKNLFGLFEESLSMEKTQEEAMYITLKGNVVVPSQG